MCPWSVDSIRPAAVRNFARALWHKLTKEWKECAKDRGVFDHATWAEMNITMESYTEKHKALEATSVINWHAPEPAQTVRSDHVVI